MMKQKLRTKSAKRRSHYSIDELSVELQIVVRKMIIDCEWPEDFENHHNGLPRYIDVIRYCRENGFVVSHSAIGRFALRIQKVSTQELKSDLRPYVLFCLADACQDFATLQNDLEAADISPERMAYHISDKNRAEFERLRDDYIRNIVGILGDLKRLR